MKRFTLLVLLGITGLLLTAADTDIPRGPVTLARQTVLSSTSSLLPVTLTTPVDNTFYEVDAFVVLGTNGGVGSTPIYAQGGHAITLSTTYNSVGGSFLEVDITYTDGLGNSVTQALASPGTGISSVPYTMDVILVKK